MALACKSCALILPETDFIRLPEVKAKRGFSDSCRRCLLKRQIRETERRLERKRQEIAKIDFARRQVALRQREALRACGD